MEQPRQAERRRPFGVVLLTLLLLAYAVLVVPFALEAPDVGAAGVARLPADDRVASAASVVLSAVAAVAAVGLWFLRRWGWLAAMILAGPTLAVEVGFYFRGEPSYPSMAVATLIALYLNSADVRRRFFPAEAEGVGSPHGRPRVPA